MLNYTPGPTGAAFLESTARVKIICGPVGGGKSTVAAMNCLKLAVTQAPFKGVRRTKVIILRNTRDQLTQTVKPLITQWFEMMVDGMLGKWHHTNNAFHFRFNLGDGTRVESDWLLMPADTPDDVRRLLSVECSYAWVEEGREVDPEILRGLRGRTNRYPNREAGGVTTPCVMVSTNPPPVGGFWHEVMTDPPKGWEVFMQPPAILDDGSLNPEAENLEHLAPGYYEDLIAGATKEWVDVYLKNKFGLGNLGQPVFRNTFNRALHVWALPLAPIMQTVNPLIVGMDNGLTAAAVIGQMDARARVNILANAYVPPGVTMGVDKFLATILVPMLRNRFPTFRNENIVFVMDPACWTRSEANEVTIAQTVAKYGFVTRRAATNDPERRVAAVEGLLMRQIDGVPGLRLDPSCNWLADAMEFGYRFKKQASGIVSATPEKTHHSHVADALQYLALHYNVQLDPMAAVRKKSAREVKRVQYAYV